MPADHPIYQELEGTSKSAEPILYQYVKTHCILDSWPVGILFQGNRNAEK